MCLSLLWHYFQVSQEASQWLLFLEMLRMNIEAEWKTPLQAAFWDDAKLKTCDGVSPAGKWNLGVNLDQGGYRTGA